MRQVMAFAIFLMSESQLTCAQDPVDDTWKLVTGIRSSEFAGAADAKTLKLVGALLA